MKLISAAILLWAISGAVAGTTECKKKCGDLACFKNCKSDCDDKYKHNKSACDYCRDCCDIVDKKWVDCTKPDKGIGQECQECKKLVDKCEKH